MKPSAQFWDAIATGGSIAAECKCGRYHFVASGDFNEGELEKYRVSAQTEPDRYIEHAGDNFVRIGHIDGKYFVQDCPCEEALARYERFIWNDREQIADYLRRATGTAIDVGISQYMLGEICRRAIQSTEFADKIAKVMREESR